MTSLVAEDVSLAFPLYSKAQQHAAAGRKHDDRIIISPAGRILAVKALRNISFEMKSGDRLALIGRNGSGKTSLLQVLAGIISPDSGRVVMTGKPTSLININLGMRQEATGHYNITLRGLAVGRSRQEIEERRAEIAEFSELGEFLDMPVETYSVGMRMRLNFAIATAFDPEILLLDEWLSAGDTAFRERATLRMQAFAAKAGIMVLASHSRKLLLDNCNLAIWLEDGKIRESGPVEALLNAYEKSFGQRSNTRLA